MVDDEKLNDGSYCLRIRLNYTKRLDLDGW